MTPNIYLNKILRFLPFLGPYSIVGPTKELTLKFILRSHRTPDILFMLARYVT